MALAPPVKTRPGDPAYLLGNTFLICDFCGKRFARKIRRIRGAHDYCSRGCFHQSKVNQVPK